MRCEDISDQRTCTPWFLPPEKKRLKYSKIPVINSGHSVIVDSLAMKIASQL